MIVIMPHSWNVTTINNNFKNPLDLFNKVSYNINISNIDANQSQKSTYINDPGG